MDYTKIKGNLDPTAPVHSTRIRVKTLSILHWFHGTLVIYIIRYLFYLVARLLLLIDISCLIAGIKVTISIIFCGKNNTPILLMIRYTG